MKAAFAFMGGSLAVMFFAFQNPPLDTFLIANTALQFVIFLLLAHIPSLVTNIMAYVDIAWPTGLFSIGLLTWYFAENVRQFIIGGVFVVMGGRMGLGAVAMWCSGSLQKEFPRYQYQRWLISSARPHLRTFSDFGIFQNALEATRF